VLYAARDSVVGPGVFDKMVARGPADSSWPKLVSVNGKLKLSTGSMADLKDVMGRWQPWIC
jgi:hypothetical protein